MMLKLNDNNTFIYVWMKIKNSVMHEIKVFALQIWID